MASGAPLPMQQQRDDSVLLDGLRQLFDNLPYGMVLSDASMVVMINRAGAAILGYEPAEMIGKPVLDFVEPRSRPRTRERLLKVISSSRPMPLERLQLLHRTGQLIMIESTSIPCSQPGRRIVQSVFRDVTPEECARREVTEAREQLHESEERYRRLVEQAEEGILTVDVNECIRFVNRRFASALGFEPGELEGRCFLDFCEESSVGRILEETAQRRRGMSSSYELTLLDRQGRPLSFLLSARPLFSEQGEFEAALVVATDITRRVREEEESRRLEAGIFQARRMESLGALAGGIAHDFNNLLMGILGNASLARMERGDASRLDAYLDRIERSALRASDLTQQMLTYSGRGAGRREAVNIAEIVQEMVELLNSVLSRRGNIQLALNHLAAPALADSTQLRQVVMNLVTNASEALPETGGIVTLRNSVVDLNAAEIAGMTLSEGVQPGRYACLSVDDNGCGMERRELERIFEPFYSTRRMGRGLGLATVFGIVRGHGGALLVNSSRGVGTSFRVYLPLAAELRSLPPSRPADCAVTPVAGSVAAGATVLIVDDEEIVLEVTRDLLQRRGFRVLTADTGRRALELLSLHSGDIEAVLLDMSLPDIDPEELCMDMNGLVPELRIIIASGNSEQSVNERFSGMGLAGFLQKPYSPADLVSLLRSQTLVPE